MHLLFDIDFRHVYGHQDGKGKTKKKKQDEKKQKEKELREREGKATRELAASRVRTVSLGPVPWEIRYAPNHPAGDE